MLQPSGGMGGKARWVRSWAQNAQIRVIAQFHDGFTTSLPNRFRVHGRGSLIGRNQRRSGW